MGKSGNPAHQERPKVYAYMLIDVLEEHQEGVNAEGYPAEQVPAFGDVVQRDDFPGLGTHSFVFEDGPLKWVCTGVYVAQGEDQGDGSTYFDYGNQRVLALLSLGQNAEAATRRLVHEAFDKVREALEPHGVPEIIADVDKLEKGFWSR